LSLLWKKLKFVVLMLPAPLVEWLWEAKSLFKLDERTYRWCSLLFACLFIYLWYWGSSLRPHPQSPFQSFTDEDAADLLSLR
jgi:hypothetical protein